MITIFDLLIFLIIAAGTFAGFHFGWMLLRMPGALVGSMVGFLITYFGLRILPSVLPDWGSIRRKKTEEIREIFRKDNHFLFSLALSELISRGVDVSEQRGKVLDLLGSDAADRRTSGWTSLKVAFPELATSLVGFDPQHPAPAYLEEINRMRRAMVGNSKLPL
jgi:hypothetical protein